MIEEVYITDVLKDIVSKIQVKYVTVDGIKENYPINFEIGRNYQIIDSLINKDGNSTQSTKYPLVAVVMPIVQKNHMGLFECNIPRIVFAHLTKTDTGSEFVLDKYDSNGVFKSVLRPIFRSFINNAAWSTFTNMGDTDMYEYSYIEQPSEQPIGEGLNDYVDIIELNNLKITIYPQIKSC